MTKQKTNAEKVPSLDMKNIPAADQAEILRRLDRIETLMSNVLDRIPKPFDLSKLK